MADITKTVLFLTILTQLLTFIRRSTLLFHYIEDGRY